MAFIIRGRVRSEPEQIVETIVVRAYDRDLRSEQLLGEAAPDREGRFQIGYTPEQFRRAEKGRADLVLRVFGPDGIPLAIRRLEVDGQPREEPAAPVFNVPPECEVDLLVELEPSGEGSEYERILAQVTPLLDGVNLADLTATDARFIVADLELDAERAPLIEALIAAARLARETGLPVEAFYGWVRIPYPDAIWEEWPQATAERRAELVRKALDRLADTADDDLIEMLRRQVDARIIPAWVGEKADEIGAALRRQGQTARAVTVRLLDAVNGQPLAGYSVAASDLSGPQADLGRTISDGQGVAAFTDYLPRTTPPDDARAFQLSIDVPGTDQPVEVQQTLQLDGGGPVPVRVPLPTAPTPALADLRAAGQLDVPESLLARLAEAHAIRSFADIRHAGGLSHLADLAEADRAAVRRLEALADLDRVSPDVAASSALLDMGYESVARIATTDRAAFVTATGDLLGDFQAARAHLVAGVQTRFLNNALIAGLAERANGMPVPEAFKLLDAVQAAPCSCADCDAAVSPRAYLTDLLRYATQRVKTNGQPIDVQFLAQTFDQPFDELPNSCAASETAIRQVRLAVETLRRFLQANPPDAAHTATLVARERQYRITAYTTLLNKVGTSFEEVRLARSADAATRAALAERLGIDLTPGLAPAEAELAQLLLDPDAAPTQPGALTEAHLEALFGLADTSRDPLSTGAKLGDDLETLKRWTLDGVRWGQTTDPDGSVFVTLAHDAAAAVYRLQLFQDRAQTKLLATAESGDADATVTLTPVDNSGLLGTIHFAYAQDTGPIEIVAVPRLLAWRLRHLRALWRAEDRPPDPYSAHELPVIDPDLVAPTDFRRPEPGQAAFDLWQARRAAVDAWLAATRAQRESHAGDADLGVDAVLGLTLGQPLTALQAIAADLAQTADPGKQAAAQDAAAALHLTAPAVIRLVELLGAAPALQAAQWDEVYAILTQAQKVARFPTWRTEEGGAGIVLGPDDFWPAASAPALPRWLADLDARRLWEEALASRSRLPIIDPDLVPATALEDPLSGPARTLWKSRADAIAKAIADATQGLDAVRQAAGDELAYFDQVAGQTLGVAVTQLSDLDARRGAGESVEADLARLTLTNAALTSLLRVRELLAAGQHALDVEWQSVFSILAQVWKERQAARWRDEEAAAGITLSPDFFVVPPPPSDPLEVAPEPLPAWRATARAQQEWQDRLAGRITAQQSVVGGMLDAIGTTEEATLPALRDALVEAAGTPGEAPVVTAGRLGRRLLMDFQVDGCQTTTRVAQAIETLQILLFRLRAGEIQALPLSLEAPRFDAEWKWIGSYATWRAAMFVFLYPENLALPELKRYKTPAFNDLVDTLRGNRQLTADQACAAAREYGAYISDVCSLSVEATCQVKTAVYGDGTCATPAADERALAYLFARTPAGKVYWSTLDPGDHSGYGQSPWRVWPFGEIALAIAGATPYSLTPQQRHIYVFFVKKGSLPATPGSPDYPQDVRISLTRYDLNRQDWEANVIDLPDPPVLKWAMRVVVQQGIPEPKPPILGIWPATRDGSSVNGTEMVIRALNLAGDGWEAAKLTNQDEWEEFRLKLYNPAASPSVVEAMKKLLPITDYHTSLRATYGTRGTDGDHYISAAVFSGQGELYRWIEERLGGKEWMGLLALGSADRYSDFWGGFESLTSLAFFRSASSGRPVCDRAEYDNKVVIPNEGKLVQHPTLTNLVRVVPNWGAAPTADIRLVYVARESSGLRTYGTRLSSLPDSLSRGRRTLVLPALVNNTPIQIAMPGLDPDKQRQHEQALFQANAAAAPAILALLEEAYFLVPMFIAARLEMNHEYTAALDWYRSVYHYGAPPAGRKVYYGLTREESLAALYQRPPDWLTDPLDPHAVAQTRRNAYTRFTLLSTVRCLLAFGDEEFTRDTPESLPRARELYTTALDILQSDELRQEPDGCAALIGQLKIPLEGPLLAAAAKKTYEQIAEAPNQMILASTLKDAQAMVAAGGRPEDALIRARAQVAEARARSQATPLVQAALAHQATRTMQQHLALLADDTLSRVADSVGRVAAGDLQDRAAVITDLDREVIGHERIALPWLREPVQIGQPDLPDVDNFTTLPFWNFPSVTFCIPPNPVLQSLRLHAALNLHKIRTCRNIAGMQRELDLYAAPTDTVSGLPFAVDGRIALPGAGNLRPTMYRYSVLVERAKQIAQLAAQVEASMLSALEKRDAEGYTWLKAQQDLRLSASNVRLNDLRVTEAQAGVDLAQIQRERAQLQEDTYQSWIEAGLNQFENEMIDAYQQGAMARTLAAFFDAGVAMGQAAASAGMTGGGGAMIVAVMAQARYMAQAEAIQQEVRTQVAAVYASFERRKQEWQLQRALAQVDGRLAEQQIRLAEDHVRVVEQERSIAQMQADNARAAVDYLANKFTTVDLYDWMSRTLEQVYAFFLRQATSVARLAETQLAFERQEPVRGDIQDDYWTAPPEGLSSPAQAPDRKGLTGSARLLQDLYQLDQYAFDTAQRKLQITKTISLARLAPAEFQRFRETGLLPFATPMEMFDRDFPGHFMRLIRRVRTSVIALIPPTDGIHATLSAGGISRVVVGPQVFQTVTIRRDPETIALSSPVNASGLFELEPAPAEMYLPFEGHGVETTWEFRLPRPANQFDYHTIADVLVTIDYTALNSFDYRQQVIRQLKPSLQADRAFSFRTDFADAWYDLHNPELLQADKQMVVSVRVERNDFPPNLDTIRIEQVLLAFARAGGLTEEIPVAHFTLTQAGGQLPVGGSAVTANGAISTRRGNAGSWAGMIGRPPFGVWELSLRTGDPNQDRRIQRWFKEEQIDDVLLVISYAGRTPDWPS